MLHGYLQHHWVGSTGGVSLFHRVARTHPDPLVAATVGEIAGEVAAERETLRTIMSIVGVTPSRLGALTARTGELLGRLKPNGHLLTRSPLTDVVEVEALRIAVSGKHAGWQLLRSVADADPRLDPVLLDDLVQLAESQLDRLEQAHLGIARKRLLT
ncbi:hypothetical protein KR76_00980 [Pimelobacter simplex]|uniref:Uncharacterized protein n=1 Tax=Nocardioides simplex TaxID=2045 RepID=A0A0C5XB22_NOCSI|nr:hypothetical protein KR76_00980 [Pimelobacter simplex]GEB15021.1 hypothetical protein NSI01_33360 [Pimelobacter simplex]